MNLIELVEKKHLRVPGNFLIGDTVDVHVKIVEGQKERIQVFSGIVIARRGEGTGETFTVRRIVAGEGVERTFPICSPRLAKVEVKKRGKVRRAKLYYLRDRVGKGTRLRELRFDRSEANAMHLAPAKAEEEAVASTTS